MAFWRAAFQNFLIFSVTILLLMVIVVHRRSIIYLQNKASLLDQIALDCDGLLKEDPKILNQLRNWTITEKLRGVLEKQITHHSTQFVHGLTQKFPLFYSCEDRPEVVWGGYEILNSTYACFEYLVKSGKPWKYYQYLSGVDLPLKTNLEMVKILKTWNNSANIDIVPFEMYRLEGKKLKDSPLPLYKSSVSAIVSRKTAERLVTSPVTKKLLDFLNGTSHSDETFWTTLLGNKKRFPVPGAFEAAEIKKFRENYAKSHKKQSDAYVAKFGKHESVKFSYYVTRMHVWDTSPKACRGKFVLFSCVFGVADLADLLRQPHFVAHKFYMDFEPAALFCGLKKIRQRAHDSTEFNAVPYSEIPYVQLHNGVPLKKLKHPLWLLGETFR